MDSLLLGTCHPLLVDNPPSVCPTNAQGEVQKFLNQLWITPLIQNFKPAVVFDENHVALASFGMVHKDIDFLRPTYIPPVPWVYMDVPMNPVHVATLRGIPNSADIACRCSLREDYWLKTILWIAYTVGGLQRIAVICGYEHTQAGQFEERLKAYGSVEVHDVTEEPWFNLKWRNLPHDKSIVDRWIEEHKNKNMRLGELFARK
jgi:hypothetical protein